MPEPVKTPVPGGHTVSSASEPGTSPKGFVVGEDQGDVLVVGVIDHQKLGGGATLSGPELQALLAYLETLR